MLKLKNLSAGKIAGSRTALAVAVTLIVGGSATEASARSRHHHHHARHHHHHMARQAAQPAADSFSNGWSSNGSSWMNANASVTPTSGTGRTFSGMASYYGNESGSRTASGQRMNANAMTCAH
ncbi:septal ring lytic transglycosylase RlpA family lipoprotein, partial [Bradyrhizobium sp.]